MEKIEIQCTAYRYDTNRVTGQVFEKIAQNEGQPTQY
jgi:hypothetical protein